MKTLVTIYYPWAPAAFCALIVIPAVFRNHLPGVLLFLPVCFFFSAVTTVQMRQEIRTLQTQLTEIRRLTK